MAKAALSAAFLICSNAVWAQYLPHHITEDEQRMLPLVRPTSRGITTPPTEPVRTMAQWEEIAGLCIRWEGTWSRSLLREIVRYAKEETTVYIVTQTQSSVVSYLSQGGVDTQNIVFVNEPSNSIWFRDYGQWPAYLNSVGDQVFIDWIYNRPRPLDDVVPQALADLVGVPLYETTQAPTDLVNTGGNFMTDGMGTAFASELILDENATGNSFGVTPKTEAQIDQIMLDFMGLDRYIKMETLPYDGIHHIDMHMKLLDEQTLLVGQYPTGMADGPQIEDNLDYVLSNFNSSFGTPYKVIRIPMPPDGNQWPSNGGDYLTYTNAVFVNGTVLVPNYYQQYDTTAMRIWKEALPGYRIRGLDCNEVITASGAIHCITKAIGATDPLRIVHRPLDDTPYIQQDYQVDATIQHRDGIATAEIRWTTDTTAGYSSAPMTLTDATNDIWTGFIPFQNAGEEVFYHIYAQATSGKQQVRPIVAPVGYWKFDVLGSVGLDDPNARPAAWFDAANGVVWTRSDESEAVLTDLSGRSVASGRTDALGRFDVSGLAPGMYLVRVADTPAQRIVVR
jgi:agmatine/peptidylarginine deiminase